MNLDQLSTYELILTVKMIRKHKLATFDHWGVKFTRTRGGSSYLPELYNHFYMPWKSEYVLQLKTIREGNAILFDKLFVKEDIVKKAAARDKARVAQKKRTKEKQISTFGVNEQKDIARRVHLYLRKVFIAEMAELAKGTTCGSALRFSISTDLNRSLPVSISNITSLGAKNIDRSGKSLHEAITKLPHHKDIMNELLTSVSDTARRFAIYFTDADMTGVGMLDKSEKVRLAAKRKEGLENE